MEVISQSSLFITCPWVIYRGGAFGNNGYVATVDFLDGTSKTMAARSLDIAREWAISINERAKQ